MRRLVVISIVVLAVTGTVTTAKVQTAVGGIKTKPKLAARQDVRSTPWSVLPAAYADKSRRPVTERKSCEDYYPEPEDAVNWTQCSVNYRSPCGGPDQCYCDSGERLLTYKCAQGTYSICQTEEKNGCQ